MKAKLNPDRRVGYMKAAVCGSSEENYKLMASQSRDVVSASNPGAPCQLNNSKGLVEYLPTVPGEPDEGE